LSPSDFRGFSCPQEGLDEDVVELITTEYAREYVRRFVDRFEMDLERRGSGLSGFLSRWSNHPSTFNDVWDVAVADCRTSVLGGNGSSVLRRAASLALRLHACGFRGEWDLMLDVRSRLRWQEWLLPEARWISVHSEGEEASVRLRQGQKMAEAVFRHRRHSWEAEGAKALPVAIGNGCQIVLLKSEALEGLNFGGRLTFARVPIPIILRSCVNALSLLHRDAAVYLPWVRRVLRSIVPVHAELSEMRSGSDFEKPGVVQVSFPITPVALAETLIHEASHQYFQILCRLGGVHDGSDTTLYYSPVRRIGRPIDKILLAYHAFANVVLFYRMCQDSGVRDSGYCERNEEQLIPQLEQLEAPLRATKALTPLGHALWEPLAERIHG